MTTTVRRAAGSIQEVDVEGYLLEQEHKSLLRFIVCGSVDDGKSTLLGRLLYESHLVFEDHLESLAADSKRFGTQGEDLDLALLVDGLGAEREQGITIDVAYRYFSTERRKFVVADTPGHEQYTRNMVTGASNADHAVVLVDARKGLLSQTRRHSYLASLLGIGSVLLVVNKLDLVDFDESTFRSIEHDYRSFAQQIGLQAVQCVPTSALHGDNVVAASSRTPWHKGPTVLGHLENVQIATPAEGPSRLPVQWVNRPDHEFRGISGTVARGRLHPGDRVRVMPSGHETAIGRIVTFDGDLAEAIEGQSVTLTLTDPIDVSRGDVVAAAASPPGVADQFEAHIVWLNEHEMLPGRPYLLKIGTQTTAVSIAPPKYKVNVNTLDRVATRTLQMNEIGVCNISVDRPIVFDPYRESREMGAFIVVDRVTYDTVGAGLLHFALRRSANVRWQEVEVHKESRAYLKHQRPCVLWFTGISGAGKSTIANIVERELNAQGLHTYLLDGDNVRHGLNRDLGFTEADRVENIRRVAEVAALMVDAGLIVLAAFISPFREERDMARALVGAGEFIEIYVDTPLEVAEKRDPKGLYRKARAGDLINFTGIDSAYEAPLRPEVRVDTTIVTAEEAASSVLRKLRSLDVIGG